MTEAPQLALDTNRAPGPVLHRQAQDERDQFVADRRMARRFAVATARRSACGASATTFPA